MHTESPKNSSSYYESIVNSLADCICLVERDMNCAAVNNAWCKALELKRENLLGMNVGELFGTEIYQEHVRPRIEKCFEGELESFQIWLKSGKQGPRHCNVSLYPSHLAGC